VQHRLRRKAAVQRSLQCSHRQCAAETGAHSRSFAAQQKTAAFRKVMPFPQARSINGSKSGDSIWCCRIRATLQGLEVTLASSPNRPAIPFLYHPPFKTGIWHIELVSR
jgi:hypothetical protein